MAYLTRGWPVVMLDLVADTTVRMPDATRVLLIVDNIQANVAVAQRIGDLLTRRRKSSGLAALLIGWPSAHELATTLSPGALLITTQGTDVIAELVRQTHAATGDIMHISELAAGDVVIARAAIDHYTDFGAVPAADELMAIIAERTGAADITAPETQRLLYWFACLGSYEIDVPADRCRRLPPAAFTELESRSLVRLDGSSYRVGHQSLASQLTRYARDSWTGCEAPSVIAVEFLRGGGDPQIRATLEKLDLFSLPVGDAGFLAGAWQSLTVLTNLLRAAESCQEPSGAFYPERVPWVTARVLLGWCQASGSYHRGPVVRRACDWLSTARPYGPFAYGDWESGTGAWNTSLMTTAMCLSALGSAGVPPHDGRMQAGLGHLYASLQERGERNEIDLADTLDAILLIGGRWQDVSAELGELLTWTHDPTAADPGRAVRCRVWRRRLTGQRHRAVSRDWSRCSAAEASATIEFTAIDAALPDAVTPT